MKTITVTQAKRSLGQYLKQAAAGEEIGIISGADIISLRKVQVIPADRASTAIVREAAPADDWPEFPTFDGGPVDGALHHDKYLYDEPNRVRPTKSRK
jgi:antitoxin (DNA-binding transcriptional repressor) of toxin-antitoxin stability system